MTDGATAIREALRAVFGKETVHLLCWWHIKNKGFQANVNNYPSLDRYNALVRDVEVLVYAADSSITDLSFNYAWKTIVDSVADWPAPAPKPKKSSSSKGAARTPAEGKFV